MKFPMGGPLLSFAFYSADVSEAAALARVVAVSLDLGAVFQAGWGTTIADGGTEDIASATDLAQWFSDHTRRVQGVALVGATDTTRKFAERVSYDQISTEAAQTDHPAIAIETDGHWTEYWIYKDGERQARTRGRHAKKRFCALVEAIRPAYAAILVETYLPCPADLRRKQRYTAFSDFFISGSYVGPAHLAQIRDLFAGAYIEPLVDGLYISSYEFFNPSRIRLAWDNGQRSARTASLIASVHYAS
jgi:hypothetical protein